MREKDQLDLKNEEEIDLIVFSEPYIDNNFEIHLLQWPQGQPFVQEKRRICLFRSKRRIEMLCLLQEVNEYLVVYHIRFDEIKRRHQQKTLKH